MLSYQHLYHAGNPADVHKHALLAWVLDYLTQKPKPLSYFETHSGRGLYQLDAPEALKTGEAAAGVNRLAPYFPEDHPYIKALEKTCADHGPHAYPGSPLIAAQMLRDTDPLHLAELHPGEHACLQDTMAPFRITPIQEDGLQMALARTPPSPRRGVMLIDPSYEVKADYEILPKLIADLHRKWNVGVVMLWYPVLQDARHKPMVQALSRAIPDLFVHQVDFAPVRPGHGMTGSGMAVVNPPYGLDAAAKTLSGLFHT